jgi:hypothetical protein
MTAHASDLINMMLHAEFHAREILHLAEKQALTVKEILAQRQFIYAATDSVDSCTLHRHRLVHTCMAMSVMSGTTLSMLHRRVFSHSILLFYAVRNLAAVSHA